MESEKDMSDDEDRLSSSQSIVRSVAEAGVTDAKWTNQNLTYECP